VNKVSGGSLSFSGFDGRSSPSAASSHRSTTRPTRSSTIGGRRSRRSITRPTRSSTIGGKLMSEVLATLGYHSQSKLQQEDVARETEASAGGASSKSWIDDFASELQSDAKVSRQASKMSTSRDSSQLSARSRGQSSENLDLREPRSPRIPQAQPRMDPSLDEASVEDDLLNHSADV